MAAVDEDGELDGAGAADAAEGVEGGADGAAGEEHVVDEDDEAAVDAVAGDVRAGQRPRGRIRRSSRYMVMSSEPTGTGRPVICSSFPARRRARKTPRVDAEEDHVVGALGALDDLVGDAGQHTGDVGALENGAGGIGLLDGVHTERTSFSASRDGP